MFKINKRKYKSFINAFFYGSIYLVLVGREFFFYELFNFIPKLHDIVFESFLFIQIFIFFYENIHLQQQYLNLFVS